MKLVVVVNTNDTVIRMVHEEADVLSEISGLCRRVLEARSPQDHIICVVVSCDDVFNLKPTELPRCSNLCGKITHLPARWFQSQELFIRHERLRCNIAPRYQRIMRRVKSFPAHKALLPRTRISSVI